MNKRYDITIALPGILGLWLDFPSYFKIYKDKWTTGFLGKEEPGEKNQFNF